MAPLSPEGGMISNVTCNYCKEKIQIKEMILEKRKEKWFCESCIRELYQRGLEAEGENELQQIKEEYGI